AQRYIYPTDLAFDDLSSLVPALFPDASDAWRTQLTAGGAGAHSIDAAARTLLGRARAALPSGIYRWGDVELAVDAARRVGWHRTTDFDLAETASFDGVTWTRRYPELGLDVTRTLGDDDIAFALANLPVWIAEPAHYARWFEVRATGAHQITLSRAGHVAFVMDFDAHERLVGLRDGAGAELVQVTWGALGPTAARVLGSAVRVD